MYPLRSQVAGPLLTIATDQRGKPGLVHSISPACRVSAPLGLSRPVKAGQGRSG